MLEPEMTILLLEKMRRANRDIEILSHGLWFDDPWYGAADNGYYRHYCAAEPDKLGRAVLEAACLWLSSKESAKPVRFDNVRHTDSTI